MKKPKKRSKKPHLEKVTIRTLSPPDLKRVNGGDEIHTTNHSCSISGNPDNS